MHIASILHEFSEPRRWSVRMLILAFVLANLWDSLATFAGLSLGSAEANPIMGGLIQWTSVPAALAAKVILAIPIAILVSKWKPRALLLATIVLALVALGNTFVALMVLIT